MAAISSNGTGGGVWSAGASWAGGAAPGAVDTATVVALDTIAVDADPGVGVLVIAATGIVTQSAVLTVVGAITINGRLTSNTFATHIGGNATMGAAGVWTASPVSSVNGVFVGTWTGFANNNGVMTSDGGGGDGVSGTNCSGLVFYDLVLTKTGGTPQFQCNTSLTAQHGVTVTTGAIVIDSVSVPVTLTVGTSTSAGFISNAVVLGVRMKRATVNTSTVTAASSAYPCVCTGEVWRWDTAGTKTTLTDLDYRINATTAGTGTFTYVTRCKFSGNVTITTLDALTVTDWIDVRGIFTIADAHNFQMRRGYINPATAVINTGSFIISENNGGSHDYLMWSTAAGKTESNITVATPKPNDSFNLVAGKFTFNNGAQVNVIYSLASAAGTTIVNAVDKGLTVLNRDLSGVLGTLTQTYPVYIAKRVPSRPVPIPLSLPVEESNCP